MADVNFKIKNGLVVNTNLLWANNGKVGINNSAPDAALTITGAANVQGNSVVSGTMDIGGNTAVLGTMSITGNTSISGISSISNSLSVSNTLTVSTDKLFVASNGNIGLGTVTPSVAIDGVYNSNTVITSRIVNSNTGTGAWSNFLVSAGAVQNYLYTNTSVGLVGTVSNHPLYVVSNNTIRLGIAANGNVGVGISNPAYKLQVAGDIATSGDIRIGGYRVVNGPAWSATPTSDQGISIGTPTKVLFGTEYHDTDSAFASSTFTAPIAGYYRIGGTINFQAQSGSHIYTNYVYLYVNGGQYGRAIRCDNFSVINSTANVYQTYVSGKFEFMPYLAVGQTAEIYTQGFCANVPGNSSTFLTFSVAAIGTLLHGNFIRGPVV